LSGTELVQQTRWSEGHAGYERGYTQGGMVGYIPRVVYTSLLPGVVYTGIHLPTTRVVYTEIHLSYPRVYHCQTLRTHGYTTVRLSGPTGGYLSWPTGGYLSWPTGVCTSLL